MSSTLLEVTRAWHEEVERLERLVARDLETEPPTNKDRICQSHRVRNMIDQIRDITHKVVEIYEDKDNARKDEIGALGGGQSWTEFYHRFQEIREYHRRHQAARYVDEYEPLLKEEPLVEFTGEEAAFGRYQLDLHELYNEYINSKFGHQIDYSDYLDVFSEPGRIPSKLKLTRRYREYMQRLLEYLIYFFERTEPLQDLERIFSKILAEFEELWSNGLIQGWQHENYEKENVKQLEALIDLDYYSTVEGLMEVGAEKLKEALSALGLKTGGTVQQRAERLFLTKHTRLDRLDRKHFAPQASEDAKEIALMEAKMRKMCELLHEAIVRTKENIEKKHGMSYDEIVQEGEEEEDAQSEDEEEQMYNPRKKRRMGRDGKPIIASWLYRLHGLDQEFRCEICGDHTYWGRRAYELHFTQAQHQRGMRRLGIPNTNNFNEITSIQEAKHLWEIIQEKQALNKWRPDLGEEYEDQEGNIYNKRTYTDLQRQGLI